VRFPGKSHLFATIWDYLEEVLIHRLETERQPTTEADLIRQFEKVISSCVRASGGREDRRQIPHFYIKLRLACRYRETACTLFLEQLEPRVCNKNTRESSLEQRRSLYFSITVNLAGTSRRSLALSVLPNEVEMSKANARGVLPRRRL
jgi:hypothetical protein